MRRFCLLLALSTACGSGLVDGASVDAISVASNIKHLVVIVMENHSFDAYFGTWCQAEAGSSPDCTDGAACCEAAPAADPGTGRAPVRLSDSENGDYDPNHAEACEASEIDSGAMDGFISARCGDPRNFALATDQDVPLYRTLASQGALADRYFQPVVGESSSNDMYFATAAFKFPDNQYEPDSIGAGCSINRDTIRYDDVTIADLMAAAGHSLAWYAEGYSAMKNSWLCPDAPNDCTTLEYFPCIYDPSDVPQAYFASTADKTGRMADYGQLAKDLAKGTLPDVAFVKPLTYHNEHPGYGTTLANGQKFVAATLAAIEKSKYAQDTLVLVTWDESGGFFDHVAPPADQTADGQPYGPRVPLIAVGPFARSGAVSHVQLEHSSIVKFIEWNWIGKTGLLQARDADVNNLGSLIDPVAAGAAVP